ncbi:MAG: glutaredoxin family protein [Brevinema sp.]
MELLVYGAKWCPDVAFAEKALQAYGIPYVFVSVEKLDKQHIIELIKANGGADWGVPTFYKDGHYFACSSINEQTFREAMEFLGIALEEVVP